MIPSELTVHDIALFLSESTTYMVVPSTERTRDLLKEGIIDIGADKELEKISDEFEETRLGQLPAAQVIHTMGVISVEDVIQYEPYHESYLLILVDEETSLETKSLI